MCCPGLVDRGNVGAICRSADGVPSQLILLLVVIDQLNQQQHSWGQAGSLRIASFVTMVA